MKTIKTYEAISKLKNAKAINPILVNYLEEYFTYLFQTFAEDESIDNFTLEKVGYIVLLEKGDNTSDLSEVGLSSRLPGSHPEYVNKISLTEKDSGNTIDIYQTFILFDNEYGLVLISEVGTLDEESEAFFVNNSIN